MTHVFTLEEAKEVMPRVQAITKPVFELATSLSRDLVTTWADTIRDLGPEVKGLWLVDFDSGDGYWCWSYPEEDLKHWHSYDGGYGERVTVEHRPNAQG